MKLIKNRWCLFFISQRYNLLNHTQDNECLLEKINFKSILDLNYACFREIIQFTTQLLRAL